MYPILLNQLIHSRVGFAWGVRASGFLTLGLLIVANCIMTMRVSPRAGPKRKYGVQMLHVLTDGTYMLAVAGYVPRLLAVSCRQLTDTQVLPRPVGLLHAV